MEKLIRPLKSCAHQMNHFCDVGPYGIFLRLQETGEWEYSVKIEGSLVAGEKDFSSPQSAIDAACAVAEEKIKDESIC